MLGGVGHLGLGRVGGEAGPVAVPPVPTLLLALDAVLGRGRGRRRRGGGGGRLRALVAGGRCRRQGAELARSSVRTLVVFAAAAAAGQRSGRRGRECDHGAEDRPFRGGGGAALTQGLGQAAAERRGGVRVAAPEAGLRETLEVGRGLDSGAAGGGFDAAVPQQNIWKSRSRTTQ